VSIQESAGAALKQWRDGDCVIGLGFKRFLWVFRVSVYFEGADYEYSFVPPISLRCQMRARAPGPTRPAARPRRCWDIQAG